MSDQPTFSVLIPYHNSHKTIAETLVSIKRQKSVSLEIIIVDDHSDDLPRKVLEAAVKDEPRCCIVSAYGRGPSAARNTAASLARGKYICFLDADDCLRPGALNTYEQFLNDHQRVGVAFGQVRITENPSSETGGIVTPPCPAPSLAQIIGENRVCTTSNIVVRRQAFADIGCFDESLSHAEDQEWLARAYLNPRWGLAGLNYITLDYRTSRGGLSSDLRRMEDGWRRMLSRVNASAGPIAKTDMAHARGLFYRYLARRALRLGDSRAAAAEYMARALRAHAGLLFKETHRTGATLIAAMAVLCFGPSTFRKVLN